MKVGNLFLALNAKMQFLMHFIEKYVRKSKVSFIRSNIKLIIKKETNFELYLFRVFAYEINPKLHFSMF